MAEDKNREKKEHKIMHEVYKAGDKFHCGECSAELDLGKDCPNCKKEFNWAKIMSNVRYY